MKKIYYFFIICLAILFINCEGSSPNTVKSSNDRNFEVIVIDSCEYIYKRFVFLEHKGNCKFCQERLEKLLKK